jgi:hypothetical protein
MNTNSVKEDLSPFIEIDLSSKSKRSGMLYRSIIDRTKASRITGI